jgi:hypothetical protein
VFREVLGFGGWWQPLYLAFEGFNRLRGQRSIGGAFVASRAPKHRIVRREPTPSFVVFAAFVFFPDVSAALFFMRSRELARDNLPRALSLLMVASHERECDIVNC